RGRPRWCFQWGGRFTMRPIRGVFFPVAAGAMTVVTAPTSAQPAAPSDACPRGETEVRPGNCESPKETPPSIVDYRPKSTLVTGVHLVKAAKYPAVDFHGHPNDLIMSAQGLV